MIKLIAAPVAVALFSILSIASASSASANGALFNLGACLSQPYADPSAKVDQTPARSGNGPFTGVITANGLKLNTPNGFEGAAGCYK